MACYSTGERLAAGAFILASCCGIVVGVLHWVLCEYSCPCTEERCCNKNDNVCARKTECYCIERKVHELDAVCEEASHECPSIVTFSLVPLILFVALFLITVFYTIIKSCCFNKSTYSAQISTNEMNP